MDLQKEITDSETRLRQQQSLYESVRAERNANSKNLVESQDEIQVRCLPPPYVIDSLTAWMLFSGFDDSDKSHQASQ